MKMQSFNDIKYITVPETEIDIEKFEHVHSGNDFVFGKYKGVNIAVDRRKQVFCHFGKCRIISTNQTDIPKDEWIFVNNSFTNTLHDFVLFTQNVVSKSCKAEFEEGDVFKFRDGDSDLDIRAQMNGIDYHGTELKNKLQTQKEKPVTKEQSKSPSFTLSDMLTQSNIGDVVGVYGPNETTVFVKASNPNVDASYICDAKGNKWVLSNRNLKPVNRNDTVQPVAINPEKETEMKQKQKLNPMALDWVSVYSDVNENELYILLREIGKQTMLWLSDKPNEQAIRIMLSCLNELPKQEQCMSSVSYFATIKFGDGFTVVLYKHFFTGKLYAYYPHTATKEDYKIPNSWVTSSGKEQARESLQSKETATVSNGVITSPALDNYQIKPKERILSKEEAIQADKESTSLLGTSPFDSLLDLANVMSTEQKALQTTTTNKMTTPTEPDYFKAALKADEQFSIDSNAKYAKFDYKKGSLPNSKLIKDETFKEYNEPVKPFSIDLFDKLTTYVPVISPVWYKDFARAGFCNTDDVNSFVSMDANGNPWFIVETPKVVKPIEKEPVVISHVLNAVDDLCNNTIPAKFCLITDTKQVYQMLYLREYNQYTQSQFAKGNPVVESIRDKADQIWVKISL